MGVYDIFKWDGGTIQLKCFGCQMKIYEIGDSVPWKEYSYPKDFLIYSHPDKKFIFITGGKFVNVFNEDFREQDGGMYDYMQFPAINKWGETLLLEDVEREYDGSRLFTKDEEFDAVRAVKELRDRYWPHEIVDRQEALNEYMRRLDSLGTDNEWKPEEEK